ncbi:hypothetical protein ABT317_07075 [Streptomyces carpinensis]|uniref:Uncharacterized protein n=1 Tax=Streptomyces carpinensis TaxID=66369 RepID=A0ABV1VXY7_9ACTN
MITAQYVLQPLYSIFVPESLRGVRRLISQAAPFMSTGPAQPEVTSLLTYTAKKPSILADELGTFFALLD